MRRWTEEESRTLLLGVGAFSLDWLRRKTHGRTSAAIYARMRRSFGGGGLARGSYTLRGACRETGYESRQLLRSRAALNQRWPRTGPGGSYLVSAEQLEDLCAWLVRDYWCAKLTLYACRECGQDDRPHRRGGMCSPCSHAVRRYAQRCGLPASCRDLLMIVDASSPHAAKLNRGYMLTCKEFWTLAGELAA